MKKAIVLTADKFEDMEVMYPLFRLQEAGGKWEDKDVVVDGNLVTSRWPADLPAFMREVMKLISNSTQ